MATSILASFRALRKDLFELQMTGRGLMLALIAPAVIVILVGQLNVRPPTLRILIAGDAADIQGKSMQDLQRLLRQLPNVAIEVESTRPTDPLGAAKRGNYDLVIVPNELSSDQLQAYSGDTEPARVVHLTELASNIERTLAVITKSEQTPVPESSETQKSNLEEQGTVNSKQTDSKKPTDTVQTLSAAGIIPPQSLYLYYPRARERSAAFLPMTIALALCFFPFIIAAPSLVREKESHTIEISLTAPGMTHNWLFTAKCYLPILVAGMGAVLMFVCAESFYQYYFKSGFLFLGLYVFLATSAATFLGLAISAIVQSTIQAAAASALYFVCLLLFGGFFVSLDQSSSAVRLIANCLPLATLDQNIKAWMFGSQLPGPSALPLRLLFGQALVFGAIAWMSYRRVFMKRL